MAADTNRGHRTGTGGGGCLRRSFVVAGLFLLASLGASAASAQPVPVDVREDHGVYRVATQFTAPQSIAVARDVLTDYERIPRFMPDVRTSRVLERQAGRAVVEQEAVARVLFFSRQVRLVLEVQEDPGTIRFSDRSGHSFTRYEGQWTLCEQDGHVRIGYELLAHPSFDVPEFILTRLLKRDAMRMIQALRAEIAARAADVPRRDTSPQ